MQTTDNESLKAWLRLTLIAGIGGQTQRKLLAHFLSPEAIFNASFSEINALIGDKMGDKLRANPDEKAINEALLWAEEDNQHILTLADANYPQALLEIADPPSVFYARGDVALLNSPSIAIVGSRNPTAQGAQNAERFAKALAEAGLTIVSGLAIGVDAAAHLGALSAKIAAKTGAKSGKTIAFIGTGIDRIYPAKNQDLARQIGKEGCILSEFPLKTPAIAANFPRRNRLISGISRGVLVVEAALESGSLITARLANEQGREVFAIPGSIHSPQARGCHKLIREGAKLVETAEDILEELKWAYPQVNSEKIDSEISSKTNTEKHNDKTPNASPINAENTPEKSLATRILEAMSFDLSDADELAARTKIAPEQLMSELLMLELNGQIATQAGGKYQRIAT